MNNKEKKIAACCGIASLTALSLGGFCLLSATCLTKIALDRKAIRSKRKTENSKLHSVKTPIMVHLRNSIRGTDKISSLSNQAKLASDNLKNTPMETVCIKANDGIRLVGHYYKCNNAKRIIIAMHGWRSSWCSDFGAISHFWHSNNCDVLYCEQRGQGSSEGDYMAFGMLERFDCLEWIKWANSRTKGQLPIYLGGISMGASTILMTAGLPLPPSVKGIVADCGYTSAHDIWRHVVKNNLKIPYDIYSPLVNIICKRKISAGSREYTCVDAMKNCKTPVMFIHGSDDRFVPIEMTYTNYKACASPKRLFIVPGATHGLCYLFNKKGYERSVLNFWHDYDG